MCVDLISGPRSDAVAPTVPSSAPQHQQGPSGEPQILPPLPPFALIDVSNTAILIAVKVMVRVRVTVSVSSLGCSILTPFLSLSMSPLLLLQCHHDAASEVQDEDLGAETALGVFENIQDTGKKEKNERERGRGISSKH